MLENRTCSLTPDVGSIGGLKPSDCPVTPAGWRGLVVLEVEHSSTPSFMLSYGSGRRRNALVATFSVQRVPVGAMELHLYFDLGEPLLAHGVGWLERSEMPFWARR